MSSILVDKQQFCLLDDEHARHVVKKNFHLLVEQNSGETNNI